EKVKDYPQLSVRVPEEVREKLQALSLVIRRPQWRLIAEAIDAFLKNLPAPVREAGAPGIAPDSHATTAPAAAPPGRYTTNDVPRPSSLATLMYPPLC